MKKSFTTLGPGHFFFFSLFSQYKTGNPLISFLLFTSLHKGVEMPKNSQAIPSMMVELPSPEVQDRNVYKCLSCDYLFGNLSDLKRHLKLRHHVEVKNLNSMEVVPSEDVQVCKICIF